MADRQATTASAEASVIQRLLQVRADAAPRGEKAVTKLRGLCAELALLHAMEAARAEAEAAHQ